MFTHVDLTSNVHLQLAKNLLACFRRAGIVMSDTVVKNTAITSFTAVSPSVATLAAHGFVDGQQITLTGGTYDVDSVTNSGDRVVTVRNTTTNTFELFGSDGTTALNVTVFNQLTLLRNIQQ